MDLCPIVLCGPSGAGKSTFINRLLHDNKDLFALSISHTTRKPRSGEINGREYYFVSKEEMKDSIAKGDFIEHAEFSNNIYGTSKKAIRDIQEAGKVCVLDIDVQGVKQIKAQQLTGFKPKYIFIAPPSMDILEKRLRGRQTDLEDAIQKRLDVAKSEIEYAKQPGAFDLIIMNDDFEQAYQQFINAIQKGYPPQSNLNGK